MIGHREPTSEDVSKRVTDGIRWLTAVEHRVYLALTGSISALTTVPSPSAPRDGRGGPGVSDPLLRAAEEADERLHTVIAGDPKRHRLGLADLLNDAARNELGTPPPSTTPRHTARWVRQAVAATIAHLHDLHNDWWLAGDRSEERRQLWIDIAQLAGTARDLRNALEWATANAPAPNAPTNHMCDDPMKLGCTRIIREADGAERSTCSTCRSRLSRARSDGAA